MSDILAKASLHRPIPAELISEVLSLIDNPTTDKLSRDMFKNWVRRTNAAN